MRSDLSYRDFFPDGFTLETPRVLLRLLKEEDFDAFLPLTRSKDTWKHFPQDLYDEQELRKWVSAALSERAASLRVPFTVIDKDTGEICGSTSYGNISLYDQRLEIGWSWLGPEFTGTGVNRNAKFALLSYAFEVMKMERVEVKTDILNERAKAALIKVGMIPEGVLRSHTLMHSGRRRDTLYFSIIKNEWPERKQAFFGEMI